MSEPGVVERAIGFALNAVGARKLEPRPADPFYDPPASVPDKSGALLKAEPGRFYIDPFRLIPAPARVERIMFTTTDRRDRVIAVTGTVLTPTRPRTKRDDRGLVAFAVGTQGMGTQCAPSRQMAAGREYESVFITGLLARGFNVVVPDYQGLGIDGVHTYMSRAAQGHVVLDALRAAQELGNPDIPLAGPTAIAGYSQGGGAAASAAELWHEYAPELDLKGAVCGAVPADLTLIARMLDGSPYFAFLGYALVGLSTDYGIDLAPLLNERGLEIATALTGQCMFESLRRYAFTRSASLTADGSSIGSLLRAQPFAGIVEDQKLGNQRYPRTDVLISHSRLDDVVPFEAGRALAERWAGYGGRVRFSTNYAPTHAAAALTSYSTAFAFLNGRFADRPMRANTQGYLHSLTEPAGPPPAGE
ncbi:MAG TPA: lipase family protein [Marmoricola sp.]|nr:lipase family protein [Marmoricola sp.]